MRRRLAPLAVVVLLAALAATPAHGASIAAYKGPGSWVDIYDPARIWSTPESVVDELSYQGVKTLYIETGNFRFRPKSAVIARPAGTARFIDAAHAAGMRVVAWYLPGFADYVLDLRRAMAAIRFRTPAGNGFDSFALDIESNQVRPIARRNAAAIRLSRAIRKRVGRRYALGAIVPDSLSTTLATGLWPGFPWRSVRSIYDVFLPMAYSVYRAHGATNVAAYTRLNIDLIRQRTGDPNVPIHLIGGLAGGLKPSEATAVVQAANDDGAVGASFYSFRSSGASTWSALSQFSR